MMGEDEEATDAPGNFNNKSVWARISVIAAGPVFNFILAFLMAVVLILIIGYDKPVAAGVTEGYPAAEAGIPAAFAENQALLPYGSVSIGWVSEDWKTVGGKPIGIGGDPSGATAEKGRIILETSAQALIPGLREIRAWKG